MFKRLSPVEAASSIKSNPKLKVIDVRTVGEFEAYHIPTAENIPMHLIPHKISEMEKNETYLIICEHSVRSVQVCYFLESQGFENIINIDGGMSEYPGEITN